jgi:hypothetical protein
MHLSVIPKHRTMHGTKIKINNKKNCLTILKQIIETLKVIPRRNFVLCYPATESKYNRTRL